MLLGAAFVVWAGVFAWIVGRGPADEPPAATPASVTGAVLFERHCGSCHAVEDLRAAAADAETLTFLESHGEASGEEDRLILDYMTGRLPQEGRVTSRAMPSWATAGICRSGRGISRLQSEGRGRG